METFEELRDRMKEYMTRNAYGRIRKHTILREFDVLVRQWKHSLRSLAKEATKKQLLDMDDGMVVEKAKLAVRAAIRRVTRLRNFKSSERPNELCLFYDYFLPKRNADEFEMQDMVHPGGRSFVSTELLRIVRAVVDAETAAIERAIMENERANMNSNFD